jgi:hypothetical protein
LTVPSDISATAGAAIRPTDAADNKSLRIQPPLGMIHQCCGSCRGLG